MKSLSWLPQNLRTQFLLLIVAIIIIPVIVMVTIISLLFWLDIDPRPDQGLSFSSVQSVVRSISTFIHSEEWTEPDVPLNTGITIIEAESSKVLFSELNHQSSTQQRYLSYNDILNDRQHDFFLAHIQREGKDLDYIISFPKLFTVTPQQNQREYLGLLVVLAPIGLMFIVGMGASLLIIKSINDKMRTLVQASSEIAAGNLDFALDSKGNDHIAQLTAAFDNMRAQLKAEETRRAQLLMSISHDLKTPLASIDGYLDALLEGFANDEIKQHRFLSIMKDKSAVLTSRINSLINFAKLTTKNARLHPQSSSLYDFVEDFVELHQPEAELKGFTLDTRLRLSPSVCVNFDPDLLFRALENLFSNAIKFSDERKTITISLFQSDKDIQLSIQNHGVGLHAEEISQIFEPLYRVSSARNTPGTGLGLSSAKYIIEAHGWHIKAVSVVNEMARFSIIIPLSQVSLTGDNRPNLDAG